MATVAKKPRGSRAAESKSEESPVVTPHVIEVEAEEVKETESLPLVKQVENKFAIQFKEHDLSREALSELAVKANAITINGVDDKENFKLADETRKELKAKRVLIQKVGKAIRDEANRFSEETLIQERQYLKDISDAEDRLEEEQDKIKKEKERMERERQQLKERAFLDRVKSLTDMGANFNGISCALGDVIISAEMVRDSEKEVFDSSIYALFKNKHDDIERVKKEDEEKLARAKQMEDTIFNMRIKEIAESKVMGDNVYLNGHVWKTKSELVAMTQEVFDDCVRANNGRIAAAKKAEETAKRIADRKSELYALGLRWNGEEFEHPAGFIVKQETLADETDEQWGLSISAAKNSIELAVKDAAEIKRKSDLSDTRYVELKSYEFTYPVKTDLGTMSDVDYEAIKKDAKKRYDDAVAKKVAEEAAAKKASDDAKAKEELDAASDETKWNHFKTAIAGIQMPEMKSKKYKGLSAKANELIRQIHVLKA